MGTGKEYVKTIEDAIIDQYPTKNGWICEEGKCINYKDGMKCRAGVFIAFVGANMAGCRFYRKGIECRHCHKFT